MPKERFRYTAGNQKPGKINRTSKGASVPTTPRPYGQGPGYGAVNPSAGRECSPHQGHTIFQYDSWLCFGTQQWQGTQCAQYCQANCDTDCVVDSYCSQEPSWWGPPVPQCNCSCGYWDYTGTDSSLTYARGGRLRDPMVGPGITPVGDDTQTFYMSIPENDINVNSYIENLLSQASRAGISQDNINFARSQLFEIIPQWINSGVTDIMTWNSQSGQNRFICGNCSASGLGYCGQGCLNGNISYDKTIGANKYTVTYTVWF